MKITIPQFLIALLIVCFGLLPKAQAVIPAPDGGYPGGNTAEGENAFLSLTTGGFNTAVGFLSLRAITTGSFNTAIGAGTLLVNTADENTATGAGALLSNTTGFQNTATFVSAGTASRSNCKDFALNPGRSRNMPVMLPPGWARLAAQPFATGSDSRSIATIAIDWVVSRAGRTAGGLTAQIA